MIWTLFRALPLLGQLATIGVLIAGLGIGYGVWHHKIYMKGWRAHEAAIARQDARTVAATRKARDVFNDCRARGLQFDQSTGKCSGG